MKKIVSAFFVSAMILSVVFLGEVTSTSNPLSASAQSMQSTAGARHRKRGAVRRGYYKTKHGVKWTAHKTIRGTKWTAHKTKRGTKWTAHKTKRGTKHIFHKTKKAVY